MGLEILATPNKINLSPTNKKCQKQNKEILTEGQDREELKREVFESAKSLLILTTYYRQIKSFYSFLTICESESCK